MAGESIMVVEDEVNLVAAIEYNLKREGFDVHVANDGLAALETARQVDPDLVLLDIMLPVLDGFGVLKNLRQYSDVPVILLTARSEEIDRVLGLELGADDYVTKPFSMRELLARIRANLRRKGAAAGARDTRELLRADNLEVDLAARIARLDGQFLNLKPREFHLLVFLIRNRGRVLTRTYILDQLWGHDYFGDERTVDVHIRWLRRKIEHAPGTPDRIVTVRGAGYRFDG